MTVKPTDFLTDEEKGLLYSFNENTKLKAIVKKFLEDGVAIQGVSDLRDENGKKLETYNPNRNWAVSLALSDISDEEKGKTLRLITEAFNIIGVAFKNLDDVIDPNKNEVDESNPAL